MLILVACMSAAKAQDVEASGRSVHEGHTVEYQSALGYGYRAGESTFFSSLSVMLYPETFSAGQKKTIFEGDPSDVIAPETVAKRLKEKGLGARDYTMNIHFILKADKKNFGPENIESIYIQVYSLDQPKKKKEIVRRIANRLIKLKNFRIEGLEKGKKLSFDLAINHNGYDIDVRVKSTVYRSYLVK